MLGDHTTGCASTTSGEPVLVSHTEPEHRPRSSLHVFGTQTHYTHCYPTPRISKIKIYSEKEIEVMEEEEEEG